MNYFIDYWVDIVFVLWTVGIVLLVRSKPMQVHWERFKTSLTEKNKDFYQGHSYVNLFAEMLRIIKIPDFIIKLKLPHLISLIPPFSIIYVIIIIEAIKTYIKDK